jgi:hypothetical protein
MRKLPVLISATLLLLCLPLSEAAAGGRSGRIPSFIPSTLGPTSHDLWISADSVEDEQGELIWDSLPTGFRMSEERLLANGEYEKYGCFQVIGTGGHTEAGPSKPRSSLKDLARNAWTVIEGTVTDIDQGFGAGNPASLLEIRVDDRLRTSEKFSPLPHVYLLYPRAEFETGAYRFCRREGRWPDPLPQVGDRVLLFPYWVPYDPALQVIVPDSAGFEVIVERQGLLAVPRGLTADPELRGVKTLEAVRKLTLEHLQEARNGNRRDR